MASATVATPIPAAIAMPEPILAPPPPPPPPPASSPPPLPDLTIAHLRQCREHKALCPLIGGQTVNVTTVHPALNPLTPPGWYRSRQVRLREWLGRGLEEEEER